MMGNAPGYELLLHRLKKSRLCSVARVNELSPIRTKLFAQPLHRKEWRRRCLIKDIKKARRTRLAYCCLEEGKLFTVKSTYSKEAKFEATCCMCGAMRLACC
jgi:hypothetical protein